MLQSIKLEEVVRFRHDPHWSRENKLQDLIDEKPYLRLESDADHSWHLTDLVLLLGPRFPEIDLNRAVILAHLHDKLEIFIGDQSVAGRSGTGKDAHGLNGALKKRKVERERKALAKYLNFLPLELGKLQKPYFEEYAERKTPESRFVAALDVIQVLLRIVYAKVEEKGPFGGQHAPALWELIDRYHRPKVAGFPGLIPYSEELLRRIKFKRS